MHPKRGSDQVYHANDSLRMIQLHVGGHYKGSKRMINQYYWFSCWNCHDFIMKDLSLLLKSARKSLYLLYRQLLQEGCILHLQHFPWKTEILKLIFEKRESIQANVKNVLFLNGTLLCFGRIRWWDSLKVLLWEERDEALGDIYFEGASLIFEMLILLKIFLIRPWITCICLHP